MKKERRQELQTNELAQMLLDAREYLSRYGNYLIGGAVVLAAIVVLFMYVRHSRTEARANVIEQMESARFFDAAGEPASGPALTDAIEILERVIEENKDPRLTERALMQLSSGVLFLALHDPQSMTAETLEAADRACRRLLRDYGDEPIAAGTALLQLATIEGNRFVLDGDPSHKEKAREHLEQITRNERNLFTATPYMERALAALNELDHTFQPVKLAAAPPPPPLPPTTAPTALLSTPDTAAPEPGPVPLAPEAAPAEDSPEEAPADDVPETDAEPAMPE